MDSSEDKEFMRQKMKTLLNSIPKSVFQERGKKIAELVQKEEWFQKSKCISIYLHMPHELPTSELLKLILDDDSKECFVPMIDSPNEYHSCPKKMKMVRLKNWEDLQPNFRRNKWNILEPIDTREDCGNTLDLIICPGLAFDLNNNRLGRGKGYYDRYLQKMGHSSKFIGICLKEQVVYDVPVDSYDVCMNRIFFV